VILQPRTVGKGNSEMGMLRKLWEVLRPGDIMLADRYMCAWQHWKRFNH
jgi:hypothetical protein